MSPEGDGKLDRQIENFGAISAVDTQAVLLGTNQQVTVRASACCALRQSVTRLAHDEVVTLLSRASLVPRPSTPPVFDRLHTVHVP